MNTPPPSVNQATNDSGARRQVRAVLFDVDGTLYMQPPLRALMAAELAALPVTTRSVPRARAVWQALREFRRVREHLRDTPGMGRLDQLQLTVTAERTGQSVDAIEAVVREWILERPLKYLPLCRRPGLAACLQRLRAAGIDVGAFSDYPVDSKLDALGVRQYFSVTLTATDAGVNAFKPHPAGFHRAAEAWGLEPGAVLYVGDRPEVDGAGAMAAGMPHAIVGFRHRWRGTSRVSRLEGIWDELYRDR